jgi:cyclohexanone monooxygenase
VPGIESFKGQTFHTSRWDYAITGGDATGNLTKLADKTIGIIGTGATAVQLLPQLARHAKKVYVFQRTPSSINVRNNRPTSSATKFLNSLKPGWQLHRQDNFNSILGGGAEEEDLVCDGWTNTASQAILGGAGKDIDPAKLGEMMAIADFKMMSRIRARVDEIVQDPTTAEKLKPWYSSMCKRPCFHDEYLQTFNQPNVSLVDTDAKGVERISERGVVANGEEYAVDIIVYSTGFIPGNPLERFSGITITGRGGQTLEEKFKDGPITLHGLYTRGFPNYFMFQTSQAGVNANFTYTLDTGAQHVASLVAKCKKEGIKSVEPAREAEEKWLKMILDGSQGMIHYFNNCPPGYYNNEGQISDAVARGAIFPGGPTGWARLLKDWREIGKLEGLEKCYSNNS